jgi:hypothetical protein
MRPTDEEREALDVIARAVAGICQSCEVRPAAENCPLCEECGTADGAGQAQQDDEATD